MQSKPKKLFVFFAIVVSLFLTGCSSSDNSFQKRYEAQKKFEQTSTTAKPLDNISDDEKAERRGKEDADRIKNEKGDEFDAMIDKYVNVSDDASEHDLAELILIWWYKLYFTIKDYSAPLFLSSEIIGLLFLLLFKGNKSLQKFGLFTLMLGVPIVIIVINFGLPFLVKLF